jgi:hypothetical protein
MVTKTWKLEQVATELVSVYCINSMASGRPLWDTDTGGPGKFTRCLARIRIHFYA